MTPTAIRTRLSVMMFLQYAIWGAWLPFLWSFLAGHREMDGDQIGWMFAIVRCAMQGSPVRSPPEHLRPRRSVHSSNGWAFR